MGMFGFVACNNKAAEPATEVETEAVENAAEEMAVTENDTVANAVEEVVANAEEATVAA